MTNLIKIKALMGFQTTMLGSIAPGQVIETKPHRAAQLIAEGRAVPYETKVVDRVIDSEAQEPVQEVKKSSKKKKVEES